MNESVTYLTQSNFYSPAFNAAIFDGPIRIYFAQYQEALALRIYFRMQNHLECSGYRRSKELYRLLGRHLFIMLYPSLETFHLSFPHATGQKHVFLSPLGDDDVIGIRPLIEDQDFDEIYEAVNDIIVDWEVSRSMKNSISSPSFTGLI